MPQSGKKPVPRQAIQSSMDEMPARQHIPSSSLQAVADSKVMSESVTLRSGQPNDPLQLLHVKESILQRRHFAAEVGRKRFNGGLGQFPFDGHLD